MEWFYPVFRKTIFTGQYLDRSIPRSRDRGIDRSIPHISLHHMTRFEPITAAHFDQRHNNNRYNPLHVLGIHLLFIIGTVPKKIRAPKTERFFPQRAVGQTISFAEADSIFPREGGRSNTAAICGGGTDFFSGTALRSTSLLMSSSVT